MNLRRIDRHEQRRRRADLQIELRRRPQDGRGGLGCRFMRRRHRHRLVDDHGLRWSMTTDSAWSMTTGSAWSMSRAMTCRQHQLFIEPGGAGVAYELAASVAPFGPIEEVTPLELPQEPKGNTAALGDLDQRNARGAAGTPDVGDGQRLPLEQWHSRLDRARSHERLHLRGDGGQRLSGRLRRTHGGGLDRGHDDTGDRRRGIRGGKPVERFDERLQRAIRRQIERAERTRDHQLEPAGHTEFTAGFAVGKKRVEELRDADDRPAAGGNGAFYGHAAVRRESHDVRRGHARDLIAHHLQRDLTNDRHGFIRPQSNPGCRQVSQGNWSIGSGHRARRDCDNPAIRNGRATTAIRAVVFREDATGLSANG